MSDSSDKSRQGSVWLSSLHSLQLATPRVLLSFVLGHPFDLIKTRMQAQQYQLQHSGLTIAADMWKARYAIRHSSIDAITGFYTGGAPNLVRTLLKESYRTPVRGGVNWFLNSTYPSGSKHIHALLAGQCCALADVVIMAPLERAKVWMMTTRREGTHTWRMLWNQSWSIGQVIHAGYRGLMPSAVRSSVSWSSYMYLESRIRELVIRSRSNPEAASHPNMNMQYASVTTLEACVIGVMSGAVNGVLTLPLDTIKTHVQKDGSTVNTLRGMVQLSRDLVRQYGVWDGLYPAFGTRLTHYVLIGAITANIIPKVDLVWAQTMKSNRD